MDEYLSKSIKKIREDAAQRYAQLQENLIILAKVKPCDLLFIDNAERMKYPGTLDSPLGCIGYVEKSISSDSVTDLKGMHEKGITASFKTCELLFSNALLSYVQEHIGYPVFDDSKLHTEETAEVALKRRGFSLDNLLKELE